MKHSNQRISGSNLYPIILFILLLIFWEPLLTFAMIGGLVWLIVRYQKQILAVLFALKNKIKKLLS